MSPPVVLTRAYNDRNIHAAGMDHDLYPWSPFFRRPAFRWPNGARLAVMVVVNVEFQDLIPPTGASPHLDVRHWSHRDYGPRVGAFRLADMMAEHGFPGTAAISDAVLERSPRVADYLGEKGWEIVGHGVKSDRPISSKMSESEEVAAIAASRDAVRAATGMAPRGWFGPQRSGSERTPALLAKAGFGYTLDWSNDDQPYEMMVGEGTMLALPSSLETSDHHVIGVQGHSAVEFGQVLIDHFDLLYEEGSTTGMGMTVNLQAHVSGQPFRAKHVGRFLDHAASREGVWFATAGAVARAARVTLGMT